MALLRMELDARQVAAANRDRELVSVARGGQDVARVVALEMIGVHEVEAGVSRERGPPVRPRGTDRVPSHVRDLELGRLGPTEAKTHRLRRQPAEPGTRALLASSREQLESDADAQDRRTLREDA